MLNGQCPFLSTAMLAEGKNFWPLNLHRAQFPTPGKLVLDMFKLGSWGDPSDLIGTWAWHYGRWWSLVIGHWSWDQAGNDSILRAFFACNVIPPRLHSHECWALLAHGHFCEIVLMLATNGSNWTDPTNFGSSWGRWWRMFLPNWPIFHMVPAK